MAALTLSRKRHVSITPLSNMAFRLGLSKTTRPITMLNTHFFNRPIGLLEPFKFYFKHQQAATNSTAIAHLSEFLRPRLKIAVVIETWPPEINGVALSLQQLCQGLQAQGHRILLIRPEQHAHCGQFKPDHECLVRAQSIPKYSSLQFGWPQYMKVGQALDAFAPDIVHIVTEGPLGLTALYAAKARHLPVSSGFHSPFQDFSRFFDLAFLLKPIQRYLCWFHNHTQLTCVPSHDTERALRQLGVSCPLRVVGRGVDTQRFHPQHRRSALREQWGASADSRVMLYVGRLSPEKEVDVLIQHYAELRAKDPATKFVVVGDGPDRERLMQLGQGSGVIFTGALTGEALSQTYASADVFVFASQVETFGNVVLEAMASGLAVWAYDYACAHQYVQHQVSGVLIPFNDQMGFAQALLQLPSAAQLNHMGRHARQHVAQVGWQQPVQQLEQALYAVVAEKTTPIAA